MTTQVQYPNVYTIAKEWYTVKLGKIYAILQSEILRKSERKYLPDFLFSFFKYLTLTLWTIAKDDGSKKMFVILYVALVFCWDRIGKKKWKFTT